MQAAHLYPSKAPSETNKHTNIGEQVKDGDVTCNLINLILPLSQETLSLLFLTSKAGETIWNLVASGESE